MSSEPSAWLSLVLAIVAMISIAVGIGADLALLTVLNRGVCGEWARPGWRNDPRCDGSLRPLKHRAYTTAKWSGGGSILAGGWLIWRRKRRRAATRREMADVAEVVLSAATADDAALLSNLLELYMHDLSTAFPSVELGSDGRFGYGKLALYWSEPDRHFPFLIRWASRVVGFALVTRGSPASDDPNVFDVAEFFVIRSHRRLGVGRRAALLLWNRLPGSWVVRASEGVPCAAKFWSSVVAEFTSGAAAEFKRPGSPYGWHVFSFASAHAHRKPSS